METKCKSELASEWRQEHKVLPYVSKSETKINYVSHVVNERGNRCTTSDEVGRASLNITIIFFSMLGPRGFD